MAVKKLTTRKKVYGQERILIAKNKWSLIVEMEYAGLPSCRHKNHKNGTRGTAKAAFFVCFFTK